MFLLAKFEAEFYANMLLLHISHFSGSVQLQNTNMTSKRWTEKTNVPTQQMPLGRLIHKGYSSRHLAAHNCTISDFFASFNFGDFWVAPHK